MLFTSSDQTSYTKAKNLMGTCKGTPGEKGDKGEPGIQGVAGMVGEPRGNVAVVDAIYGNDATASIGGSPYLTVNMAVSAITSGQSVWILPGTYNLTSPIVLPVGSSIRGFQLQTVNILMAVTTSTTMITMMEQSSIEDLTITLTATGTTDNLILTAIYFTGASAQTCKILHCIITINNSSMNSSLTNAITGILCSGVGELLPVIFTFISITATTINIYSNGAGKKRGILINNTNVLIIYDSRIFVAQPIATTSTGSYVGVETADTNNLGSIQIRTSTVGCVTPATGHSYTASDILQTNPPTITTPTYLTSPGIQIGPGTDLVTKSAGGKGFFTLLYPSIIFYGLKGSLTGGTQGGGYLWPGTMAITSNVFPDPGTPPAYFRAQQPCLICGLSFALNIPPGGTNTTTAIIRYTPIRTGIVTDTIFTITLTGTTAFGTIYNGSLALTTGDLIHLYMTYTGSNANNSHDITAQIDMY